MKMKPVVLKLIIFITFHCFMPVVPVIGVRTPTRRSWHESKRLQGGVGNYKNSILPQKLCFLIFYQCFPVKYSIVLFQKLKIIHNILRRKLILQLNCSPSTVTRGHSCRYGFTWRSQKAKSKKAWEPLFKTAFLLTFESFSFSLHTVQKRSTNVHHNSSLRDGWVTVKSKSQTSNKPQNIWSIKAMQYNRPEALGNDDLIIEWTRFWLIYNNEYCEQETAWMLKSSRSCSWTPVKMEELFGGKNIQMKLNFIFFPECRYYFTQACGNSWHLCVWGWLPGRCTVSQERNL